MDDDRRRRRPQATDAARLAAQQGVGRWQFSGQHYCVAGDALILVGVHRRHAVAGAFQAGDRRVIDEAHSGIGRGGGQRVGQRPHASARKENSGDGIHVGDNRIHRQGLPRRHPGVQRLEGEDSLEPPVGDVAIDHGVPFAESTNRRQSCQLRIHQRQWGIEVPADESIELGGV